MIKKFLALSYNIIEDLYLYSIESINITSLHSFYYNLYEFQVMKFLDLLSIELFLNEAHISTKYLN